jgi:protein-L-isoaspartate(D-aspartate) O-methyltransferase
MPDFATRRTMMVDNQVRPSDVTKLPIIEAMLTVPRERFVPGSMAEAAYVGENLDLGNGRVLLEPRTLAKMLDALDIHPDHLVLDIAVATGYSSAVIACFAEAVVAVESESALADEAAAALDSVEASNVILEPGPIAEGAPSHGPYDAMVIQGGIERFPQGLADQLKEGGRVVALFVEGSLGVVRLGVRQGGDIHWRDSFNASAPLLEEFRVERSFAL